MALATSAEQVLSTDEMKVNLRISADETEHDALITQQIAAAVGFVGDYISCPLISTDESLLVDVPAAEQPIRIRATRIVRVNALRYWNPGQAESDEPAGNLALAGARFFRDGASPYMQVWPPGGAWPVMERMTALVDITRGLAVSDTENAPVKQAVILLCMRLYDGLEMQAKSVERLLAAYRDMSV